MVDTHLAYGSQVCRDLTGPSVPTQHIQMRTKGIKYINNPLVITTQNKKRIFIKVLMEGFNFKNEKQFLP